MHSHSASKVSSFGNLFVSVFLWIYAGFVLFTWYIARLTPDWAVLLRVLASISNDLIWIPLGIIIWIRAVLLVTGKQKKGADKKYFSSFAIIIGVTAGILLFQDYAFKFLFIPLALIILSFFHVLLTRRHELQIMKKVVPFALIIILTVIHYQYQMLPHKIQARSGKDIKIMTYNVNYDASADERKQIVEAIRNEGADLVCLMEFNPVKDNEIFDRELAGLYPYKVQSGNPPFSSSGAIISKFPIVLEELPDKKGNWNDRMELILAELDVKGKKIHIVNFHLKTVGHFIVYVADKDLDFKKKILFAAKNEIIYDREKYNEAKYIENLLPSSESAIICGDLNDTPNSRAFHILDEKYTNTFSSKGWGLGATFGEKKMKVRLQNHPILSGLSRDFLRIDQIFVSKGMKVISSKVLKNAKGSDHKPVVSVVEIK
jgi:endonuclease/exonuclease/phosphatase family metal-dependent hydrolase